MNEETRKSIRAGAETVAGKAAEVAKNSTGKKRIVAYIVYGAAVVVAAAAAVWCTSCSSVTDYRQIQSPDGTISTEYHRTSVIDGNIDK